MKKTPKLDGLQALELAGDARPEEFKLLKDNVRDELLAQNALQKLNLNEQQINTLAWAICVNIDYVFRYKLRPKLKKKVRER